MEAEVTLLWGALCVKSSYTVAHNSLLHTYHTFPTFLRHALTVSYEGFISIAPSFKDQQWEGGAKHLHEAVVPLGEASDL